MGIVVATTIKSFEDVLALLKLVIVTARIAEGLNLFSGFAENIGAVAKQNVSVAASRDASELHADSASSRDARLHIHCFVVWFGMRKQIGFSNRVVSEKTTASTRARHFIQSGLSSQQIRPLQNRLR